MVSRYKHLHSGPLYVILNSIIQRRRLDVGYSLIRAIKVYLILIGWVFCCAYFVDS